VRGKSWLAAVIRFFLEGEDAQETFGRRLAAVLESPCVVILSGELGSGKTTLVRGVLRGLGHERAVRSPTYTLLEPYELSGKRVLHVDLYRLGDPQELEYLGLTDLMDESLLFVEWPERAGEVLQASDLEIRIEYALPGRDLTLVAHSELGRRLLGRLGDRLAPEPT
jgi:tRNA threonylcarbamoyladenosine biosynthesis protein TsaE